MKTGSCLCGGVAFEVHGELSPATACHCTQCRKQTGNYWVSASIPDAGLKFTRKETLAWYRASSTAQRGFCKICGSTLFWKADNTDTTSICAGTLDGQTGLVLEGHIFCDNAGDYYEIAGGSYRKGQW